MGIIPFQKPDKVVMHKANDFHGVFEFSPLEKGYGTTIGNSLRRILLSSLEGYAITGLKIHGVDHEFSTIKGVIEDVVDVVLNLKQVRFKKTSSAEDTEKIYISVKGKDQFIAGDISRYTNSFTVLNPEQVICNLEPTVNLEVELTVQKGRGYVPADENKQKDAPIGYIPVDAIYTPIRNVKYLVEDFRVEQRTDYEKLILEISTDGSVHPEDALMLIAAKDKQLPIDAGLVSEAFPELHLDPVDQTYLTGTPEVVESDTTSKSETASEEVVKKPKKPRKPRKKKGTTETQ
jgi:DNA-directed RNA polymerase subunit alpha